MISAVLIWPSHAWTCLVQLSISTEAPNFVTAKIHASSFDSNDNDENSDDENDLNDLIDGSSIILVWELFSSILLLVEVFSLVSLVLANCFNQLTILFLFLRSSL